MPVKKFVLMMAGGSGSRMNNNIPKQFVELNGKPVIMHTFQVFYDFDPTINFILVLPEQQVECWKQLCEKHNFCIPHEIAFGGETRFFSVKNGLEKISGDGIVFIHDSVRPLVSVKTIENCLAKTLEKGNALPVVAVTESVRKVKKDSSKAVDRNNYKLVQTPQTFKVDQIKKAYLQTFSEHFTDDASVLENTGEKIHLVDGNHENIKITYPQDLTIAEALLKKTMIVKH
jgi:2-C-methyl-D-erythritol 4-phosphate cytidylyltransferase